MLHSIHSLSIPTIKYYRYGTVLNDKLHIKKKYAKRFNAYEENTTSILRWWTYLSNQRCLFLPSFIIFTKNFVWCNYLRNSHFSL